MSYTSTIIALAWPETKVVKEGKWYDRPMETLSFVKDGYYNAGHAALLLINDVDGHIEYFDFGRYHTPYQKGRVRDRITDPDIEIKIKAIINKGQVTNINEILTDRFNTKACHGDGILRAAIVKNIDYKKAYLYAKQLQKKGAIDYGPFTFKGSTCSRLVVQVVFSSSNNWLTKLLIKLPYTVSATPRSNIKVLNDTPFYYEVSKNGIEKIKNKWFWFKQISLLQEQNGKSITQMING